MIKSHNDARGPGRLVAIGGWLAALPGLLAALGGWLGPAAVMAAEFACTVDATQGPISGVLEAIDANGVRVAVDGAARTLAVDAVRAVTRVAAAAPPAAVAITCIDGSQVTGTDVTVQGDELSISHPAGGITMPLARVRSIAWRDRADAADWQASLPRGTETDLVVVRKADGFEFVECAITGVNADTVTVVLDEETIPVKRAKVLGLHWLRQPAPAAPVIVRIDGGQLTATEVAWSPEGLVVDKGVRLPAAALVEIDYASGRTVHVATLPTERLEVEPFFGSVGKVDGLAGYFQPRAVAAIAGGPKRDLLVRPRTVAVWRIPPGSREFRTSLSTTAAGAGPAVVIAVDGKEVFRGPIDRGAAGADGRVSVGPIPVTDGRRLELTVDFGSAGAVGGAVLLHDPVLSR